MSNEALTLIEIDIQVCSLTYGASPCTASLTSSPPTGTDKCVNSIPSCQDRVNFTNQTVTWRFAKGATYLPRDIDIVSANILDVDFSPAAITLGEGLGQRASMKVTFADHPHSDAGPGFDKYHAERLYNPFEQGTLWGKFRRRQPYLRGAAVRLIYGFVGQTLAEMETRHFLLETLEGPTGDGRFSIVAKDVLKFLDGDRATVPRQSNGFLNASINSSVGTCVLAPAGIGNDEYPATGIACIGGNELVSFSRAGDTLTIARGVLGSTARAHEGQDLVQVCASYSALDPAVILADLIQTYTDTPAGYLDFSGWTDETADYFGANLTLTVVQPTAVSKVVSDVLQQIGGCMWDDNVNQKMRLQILRAVSADARVFSESNTMKSAPLTVTEQPDKRYSRVRVYYGLIDPTRSLDDIDNYRSNVQVIDDQAEEDYGSEGIKVVKAYAIAAGGSAVATRLCDIILSRYRDPPRKFGFSVMRRNVDVPELAGAYNLQWQNLQDLLGARENVPIQVTRLQPRPESIAVEGEEIRVNVRDGSVDLSARPLTIDYAATNVNWKTLHDQVYPLIEAGQSCTLTISVDGIVASTNNSLPALEVGDWPPGVTLNLIVLGRIQGKGGNAGAGQYASLGAPGQAGGGALYTREAINLTDTSGQIWGGGGGGGGGGSSANPYANGGGGGGGGAGSQPGLGGAGGGGGINSGAAGTDGTSEAAGLGGDGGGPNGDVLGPGGDGGSPGQPGGPGATPPFGGLSGGAGGAAGAAIDGVSFVTTIGGAGDRRGGQIN